MASIEALADCAESNIIAVLAGREPIRAARLAALVVLGGISGIVAAFNGVPVGQPVIPAFAGMTGFLGICPPSLIGGNGGSLIHATIGCP